jgi:hypothetical protein
MNHRLIEAMREQEKLFYRVKILSRNGEQKKLNKIEKDLGIIYNLIMKM